MAKGMDPLGDIPSDSDESDAEEEAHAPAPAPRPESKIDYEALRAHGMKSAPSVLGIQEKRGDASWGWSQGRRGDLARDDMTNEDLHDATNAGLERACAAAVDAERARRESARASAQSARRISPRDVEESARPAMRSARTRTRGATTTSPSAPGRSARETGTAGRGRQGLGPREKRARSEKPRDPAEDLRHWTNHTREPTTVPGVAHDATRTNVRNEPTVARRVMGDKTRLAARSSRNARARPAAVGLRPSPSHPLRRRRDHRRGPPPQRRDPRSRRRQTRSRRRQTRSRRRRARRARHHLRLPHRRKARRKASPVLREADAKEGIRLGRLGASQVRRELILQLHVLHGSARCARDDGHERLSAKSIVQTRSQRAAGFEPRPGS